MGVIVMVVVVVIVMPVVVMVIVVVLVVAVVVATVVAVVVAVALVVFVSLWRHLLSTPISRQATLLAHPSPPIFKNSCNVHDISEFASGDRPSRQDFAAFEANANDDFIIKNII